MSATTDRLYELLPEIHRLRDAGYGEPLRALLAVIDSEAQALQADIAGLYENWFVETCEEWVVPYLADLLGVRGLLLNIDDPYLSQRARVANTIRHRRRKGTAQTLQELARDVTGWPALVVESHDQVAMTQHLVHLRPGHFGTADLRQPEAPAPFGGRGHALPHTASIRDGDGQGPAEAYNLDQVGLLLWRLRSYFVTRGSARRLGDPAEPSTPLCYSFDPLGRSIPLFNRPRGTATRLLENLPERLTRRGLQDDLDHDARRFLGDEPVCEVIVDDKKIPVSKIRIADLSRPDSPRYEPAAAPGSADGHPAPAVLVDPELGRLLLLQAQAPTEVLVSYAYGFGADLGGGPYTRAAALSQVLPEGITWLAAVCQDSRVYTGFTEVFPGLREAVNAWNQETQTHPATVGAIVILDSTTYHEELTGASRIVIPPKARLLLIAAGSYDLSDKATVELPRQLHSTDLLHSMNLKMMMEGADLRTADRKALHLREQLHRCQHLIPGEVRPHLRGNLWVEGLPGREDQPSGELILEGLLIEGEVRVAPGNLGLLRLSHCTVTEGVNEVPAPAPPAAEVDPEQAEAEAELALLAALLADPAEEPAPPPPRSRPHQHRHRRHRDLRRRNLHLAVQIERCLCGPVVLPRAAPALQITDSLIRGPIVAPGAAATVQCSTILARREPQRHPLPPELLAILESEIVLESDDGETEIVVQKDELILADPEPDTLSDAGVSVRSLEAGNTLFTTLVQVQRRQVGCVRFSYAPPGSVLPRSYQCQQQQAPWFTSTHFGDPALAQLSPQCPAALRQGGEEGSEMGVYHHLMQPQREASLRKGLDEYLPLGLRADIFFVT